MSVNKVKTGAGTKVTIDGEEINQVISVEIAMCADSMQSAKIELPLSSVTTDEDGNITFNLATKL